jgi:hypothetical protein
MQSAEDMWDSPHMQLCPGTSMLEYLVKKEGFERIHFYDQQRKLVAEKQDDGSIVYHTIEWAKIRYSNLDFTNTFKGHESFIDRWLNDPSRRGL